MIVKLQRPLSSSVDPVLIYDQSRRHQWFVQLSKQQLQALLGDDPKGYFEAIVGDSGEPVLGQRVVDQPW